MKFDVCMSMFILLPFHVFATFDPLRESTLHMYVLLYLYFLLHIDMVFYLFLSVCMYSPLNLFEYWTLLLSTHYKTVDTTYNTACIQYITNISHSVLTGDMDTHSTLWHSNTDDHITLNINTPTRVPNIITTVSSTLYNRTSWTTQHTLSSHHLPIITTINIQHDYRLQQIRQTFSNYKKADWTQFTEDTYLTT